jgi:hypothetical protein
MTDQRQSHEREAAEGPFPARQAGGHPWEATEKERGPFERRRTADRRCGDLTVRGESPAGGRRRRWGRRKTDIPGGSSAVPGQARNLAQRFRTPLIGLALAGMAVPLVNATVPGESKGPAQDRKKAGDVGEASEDAAVQGADLDEQVGKYWAEAQEDAIRMNTIEGAITRWEIDRGLAEKIYDYATKHEIEPDVAYGLVFTESTFRDRAVSHVGARGLTQLMPRTAKWLDPDISSRDLYDPDVNLDLGFQYLRQLIDKYGGDVENALTAYNRGPGTVDRILKRGGNPDNGYAGKVLAG